MIVGERPSIVRIFVYRRKVITGKVTEKISSSAMEVQALLVEGITSKEFDLQITRKSPMSAVLMG